MLVIMAKCLLWGRRKDTQKSLTTGDSCIRLRGAPWHLFSAMISLRFSVMLSVAFFTYTIPYISRDGRHLGTQSILGGAYAVPGWSMWIRLACVGSRRLLDFHSLYKM